MSIKLGPLPAPAVEYWDDYTADQMRAYAEQEVARERAWFVQTLKEWDRTIDVEDCLKLRLERLKADQQSTDQPPGSTPSAFADPGAR